MVYATIDNAPIGSGYGDKDCSNNELHSDGWYTLPRGWKVATKNDRTQRLLRVIFYDPSFISDIHLFAFPEAIF